MKIHVRIERLVLEGLPIAQRQGPQLQAAVENELVRLLTESRSTGQFNTGRELASISGGSIQVAEHAEPAGLGEQIAAAVYGGIGGRI